jgi:glycosyltransferase involved in cell wall biosynthesis
LVLKIEDGVQENNQKVVSIIVRALNEIAYLPTLISAIRHQKLVNATVKIVVVDSGSSDGTFEYATYHADLVVSIEKAKFSFGRAINLGLDAIDSQITVLVSAHCIPRDEFWLRNLIEPILAGEASASYGKQEAPASGCISESNIFKMQYPSASKLPDNDPKFNNANSAFATSLGIQFKFDENLTGLEDIDFALKLLNQNFKIAYVANATVTHYHNEKWKQIFRRFERESRALISIRGSHRPTLFVTIKSLCLLITFDLKSMRILSSPFSILSSVRYRTAQFLGIYFGSRRTQLPKQNDIDRYFFNY